MSCRFIKRGPKVLHRAVEDVLVVKRLNTSWPIYPRLRRHFSGSASSRFSEGALAGVRILDLSRILAAPYCTQILADYGAEVIKVEDVGKGDDTRHWRILGEDKAWKDGIGPMSNYFAAVNRNKRSMTLNLKHEKGKEIFLKLAETSDVVVENFRPGNMDKLGIGYDTLSAINPRIIHASTSGYGSSGPSAQRAGYDMTIGAEAGLLHLTGERGGRPVRPGLGLTDMCTGLYMHGAIMGALYARERTGKGQKLDGSLFETQVALLINVAMAWLNLGVESERWGTQHPSVVPYDAFKTKDLYFVSGAMNDQQFKLLCEILGKEGLGEDERFKTNEKRVQNRNDLIAVLNELFAARTTDEWLQKFEGTKLPYAPINSIQRVFEHPQTKARDMVTNVEFEAAKSGSLTLVGPPIKFSETKATIRNAPPLLGEHNKEILDSLGYSGTDQERFKEQNVI